MNSKRPGMAQNLQDAVGSRSVGMRHTRPTTQNWASGCACGYDHVLGRPVSSQAPAGQFAARLNPKGCGPQGEGTKNTHQSSVRPAGIWLWITTCQRSRWRSQTTFGRPLTGVARPYRTSASTVQYLPRVPPHRFSRDPDHANTERRRPMVPQSMLRKGRAVPRGRPSSPAPCAKTRNGGEIIKRQIL